MSVQNFGTRNASLRALLSNGLAYTIPKFQRDYAWTIQEWEELWEDVHAAVITGSEPAHYMGYLVLKTHNDRHFSVIDGQQRLVTLSLLVLAGMRVIEQLVQTNVEADDNRQRLQQLRANYIGYLDPVTLVSRSKLTLNRHDDGYYRDYLVPLRQPLPQRGFTASAHAMRQAFAYFTQRLAAAVQDAGNRGMAVAQLLETMSDRLFFTVITVADELNAYRVFETLNARGVRLSTTDLLKNYVFSVVARDEEDGPEMQALERLWDTIVERLGSESFPGFLRAHWNSRAAFARQSELFRVLRAELGTRREVFARVHSMGDDVDPYLAMTRPDGSDWPEPWRRHLRALRLFSVRQPLPMLLAGHRRLAHADFGRLLHATEVISFRYSIIGQKSTGELERIFHQVAAHISRGEPPAFADILRGLAAAYPDDREFRAAFSARSIPTGSGRNGKLVRYILGRLEEQQSNRACDVDGAAVSLEHVLPQEPGPGWDEFEVRDRETFTYRLGNMALMEATANRQASNLHFADKRAILGASAYATTAAIAAANTSWTPDRLRRRQADMARQATAAWRIGQLAE